MADGKVIYTVDYDTSKAKRELKGFSATLSDVGEKAGNLGNTMTTKVTAPILAGATAVTAGFFKISNELDALAKSAAGVNSTVEGLQALQFAGRKAGIESDKMTDVLKKVQELTARNGELFKENGIQIEDMNGEMLNSDAIFNNVIDSLGDMNTEQRNATLLALGFTEELVAINKAMEDTAGFAANVQTGMENAVSDDAIQDFEEFNDKVEDLKQQFGLVAVEVAEKLLPHFNDLADWLINGGADAIADFIGKLADFIEENWKLIGVLALVGPALQVFSNLVVFGTNVMNLVNKLRSLTSALNSARAAASSGKAATTATTAAKGIGLSGGATAALGYAGIGLATVGVVKAVDKAVEKNIEKYGPGGSGQYGLSAAQRSAMMGNGAGIYDAMGLGTGTQTSVQTAGTGAGTVQLNIAEMNLKTELDRENASRVVDEIMTSVGNELTMRQVFGK